MSFAVAGRPVDVLEMPPRVRDLLGDGAEAIWLNQLGGSTWRTNDLCVKWQPVNTANVSLQQEFERLQWAHLRIPSPEPISTGRNSDGQWLATRTIRARSAIEVPKRQIESAVAAIAAGLRQLHNLPTDQCPYVWSVEHRCRSAIARIADADFDPQSLHPQHRQLSAADIRRRLADRPVDDVVVCHGDACAPNTVVDDDAGFVALVDIGSLGVGDRWSDLAVAAWSLEWNFGPGWEDCFFDAYGIESDPRRVAWHQLLWDLG